MVQIVLTFSNTEFIRLCVLENPSKYAEALRSVRSGSTLLPVVQMLLLTPKLLSNPTCSRIDGGDFTSFQIGGQMLAEKCDLIRAKFVMFKRGFQ